MSWPPPTIWRDAAVFVTRRGANLASVRGRALLAAILLAAPSVAAQGQEQAAPTDQAAPPGQAAQPAQEAPQEQEAPLPPGPPPPPLIRRYGDRGTSEISIGFGYSSVAGFLA